MGLKVEKIVNGMLSQNCYFVHEENSKVGFCIDPGYDNDTIMKAINKNGFIVEYVLLTHAHFDHILSCYDLIAKFNPKIMIGKIESKILFEPELNYSNCMKGRTFERYELYKTFDDNDMINLYGYIIKCINTPGHTRGGFSYYIESEKILFSGDTLFRDTYGRTDCYSGSFKEIKDSIINKLFSLPEDTIVYTGHGEDTTIAYEKKNNPIREDEDEF